MLDLAGSSAACRMTSGDIVRLLDVDLKTVHNWVNQGYLRGRRTKGRHLRFHRTEIVRFMRRFGYPLAQSVSEEEPRVVLVGSPEQNQRAVRSLGDGVCTERCDCLFDAALAIAAGGFEVVVIDLDEFPMEQVEELVEAVRNRAVTQGLGIVGVSGLPEQRQRFSAAGGDVAIAAPAELSSTVPWLIGAVPESTRQTVASSRRRIAAAPPAMAFAAAR